jgi:outer membrane protein W
MQVAFTLGMLNYTGDALDIVDPSNGNVLVSTGGLSGMNFGLNLANNVSDWIGWELWSGVTLSEKGFTLGGISSKVNATRVDVGLAPRIQTTISMGEQGMHFIPYIGMGPVYTYTNYATQLIAGGTAVAGNAASSAVGMSMNVGADVQLGNALIGLKFKYILSRDLSGGLKSNDMSAMLPSLSVGWAF